MRYKKQNAFVLFFSGSDWLWYQASDLCKKLAKPGSVFYFLQCPLPLYVWTNYQIQRNWSHYSINIIPCRILCESMLSPSVKVYKCSHSLNIRSFYGSHFCNNKKTPKEKKQKQTNNKNKTKEKNPPKTNKQKRSSSVSVLKVKTLYKQYVCHE